MPFCLHRKMKKRNVVVGVLILLLLGLSLFLGLFFGLRSAQDGYLYKRAAVATDAGQCSIIGRYLSLFYSLLSLITCNKMEDPSFCGSRTVLTAFCQCGIQTILWSLLRIKLEDVRAWGCLAPYWTNTIAGSLRVLTTGGDSSHRDHLNG